mmetsp:Transcript_55074/g.112575  ORF Transcript_55074/g.112575 Transcript_55074/m.112575 type:complete len:220 (+) Transcript_55074:1195-1854(+)
MTLPHARTGAIGTAPEISTSGTTDACSKMPFCSTKLNSVAMLEAMVPLSVRDSSPAACSHRPEFVSKSPELGPEISRKHTPEIAHAGPAVRSVLSEATSPEIVMLLPAGIARSGWSETEMRLGRAPSDVESETSKVFSHRSVANAMLAGGFFHAPRGHSAEQPHCVASAREISGHPYKSGHVLPTQCGAAEDESGQEPSALSGVEPRTAPEMVAFPGVT